MRGLVRAIKPAPELGCWIATIKGKMDADSFKSAVERQLEIMGVFGTVVVGERRTIAVKGSRIVGFRLTVGGLSDRDSLTLQARGVGGRNRFGCGVMEGRR